MGTNYYHDDYHDDIAMDEYEDWVVINQDSPVNSDEPTDLEQINRTTSHQHRVPVRSVTFSNVDLYYEDSYGYDKENNENRNENNSNNNNDMNIGNNNIGNNNN